MTFSAAMERTSPGPSRANVYALRRGLRAGIDIRGKQVGPSSSERAERKRMSLRRSSLWVVITTASLLGFLQTRVHDDETISARELLSLAQQASGASYTYDRRTSVARTVLVVSAADLRRADLAVSGPRVRAARRPGPRSSTRERVAAASGAHARTAAGCAGCRTVRRARRARGPCARRSRRPAPWHRRRSCARARSRTRRPDRRRGRAPAARRHVPSR